MPAARHPGPVNCNLPLGWYPPHRGDPVSGMISGLRISLEPGPGEKFRDGPARSLLWILAFGGETGKGSNPPTFLGIPDRTE
jgi:hypothetical protein